MKTKKSTLSILFCCFIVLAATSCGSKDDPEALPDPIQKEIITQIFGAGSSTSGLALVSPAKTIANQAIFKAPAATSVSIPASTEDGPNGGTLTLSGSMDATSSAVSLSLTEVFASYGIIAESKTYTMSGTIQYVGGFTATTTKLTGKLTANGSLTVVGVNYNKQMAVNLTETMSSNLNSSQTATSTTVTVKGTIGGQAINYTTTE